MLEALVSCDAIVMQLPVKLEVEFAALEETLEEDMIGGGGTSVIVDALPWVSLKLLNVLPVTKPDSALYDICRGSFLMGGMGGTCSRLGVTPGVDLGRL
jgi:hypothetical protein